MHVRLLRPRRRAPPTSVMKSRRFIAFVLARQPCRLEQGNASGETGFVGQRAPQQSRRADVAFGSHPDLSANAPMSPSASCGHGAVTPLGSYVPTTVVSRCSIRYSLFDHLVGAGEQRRWNFDAERFGSLVLITISNLVGCCTGRSPGFSPRYAAARRN